MAWASKITTLTGLVLLAHACYSAQEHHALSASLSKSLPNQQPTASSLPLDISIEAILSTLITCLGLVLGSPALRPIQWNVWAGKIEREGLAGVAPGSNEELNYRGNPFRFLDSRPNFTDIRKQRKEFAAWVKGNEGK